MKLRNNNLHLLRSEYLKNILKVILVGTTTTICRIIGQFLIPAGEQSVLEASVFASNGTMPLVFTLYGIFAYSLIASMFVLVRNQLTGNRVWQGVKYGISCCAIWVVYLLEPLPHVAPLDRITYPIADGVALLVMGLLLGFIFGNQTNTKKANFQWKDNVLPVLAVTALFTTGRIIQYLVFDIYSSFGIKPMISIVWSVCTGLVVAGSLSWLNQYVITESRLRRFLLLGPLLFGVNLTLFNFFMPLVFNSNLFDLVLRTCVDIAFVSIGCIFFKPNASRYNDTGVIKWQSS